MKNKLELTEQELRIKVEQFTAEVMQARKNKTEISKRIKEIKSKIYDNQQELEKD